MGIHDELYKEGAKLGFAHGGQVKDTGNQPAKKGTSQQEIEAGGTPKLRPGYKDGGKAKRRAKKGAEKMAKKGVKKVNQLKKTLGAQATSKERSRMKTHKSKPMIGK